MEDGGQWQWAWGSPAGRAGDFTIINVGDLEQLENRSKARPAP